ncbi:HK97 family phage prohead protease [Mesorhizobium sp. M7A.F.Ce.TU.012.03.2.1]|uniref:HK97 family phage prohead protease n=1 Tax=Mesorhizobium sp. M7A.F.Ce.TU.012.03.2.1 TaxID=2493681 RepID=UPI000FD7B78A|nr:HK97 family phage prohead protease [Mesorhizobium sp. M7A.F.Ce.TU.012.03.2.1]AZV21590.1 HK97 family phage prohead protease [Mesorhizobium sp. M7A.F.Ce.TU.012.03.2.1]
MADNVISGYAVRFNDITTIGQSFRERISPGAFTESLKRNDIVALIGHDTGRVLGRVSAGTLTLREDRIGLWFSLDVDKSTPSGQEALGTVGRGDVKGCSFAGQFLAEDWQDGGGRLPLRTVTEIDLYEITLTAFPAYETTDASVRKENNASAARERLLRKAEAAMRLRGIH